MNKNLKNEENVNKVDSVKINVGESSIEFTNDAVVINGPSIELDGKVDLNGK